MSEEKIKELAKSIAGIGTAYNQAERIEIIIEKLENAIPKERIVIHKHEFERDFLKALEVSGNKIRTRGY